jgi:hypothetical protein
MKPLNRATLNKFIKQAGDQLEGEWVVIGGTVLPLLGIDYRSTVDIDFICLKNQGNAQLLQLMEIAEGLGLPVETINQAGALFLLRIADFKDHLKILYKGKKARIYRPDGKLFFQLKIARLSETDLTDCLEFLKWSKLEGEKLDHKVLIKLCDLELKKSPSDKKHQRLLNLKEALQ